MLTNIQVPFLFCLPSWKPFWFSNQSYEHPPSQWYCIFSIKHNCSAIAIFVALCMPWWKGGEGAKSKTGPWPLEGLDDAECLAGRYLASGLVHFRKDRSRRLELCPTEREGRRARSCFQRALSQAGEARLAWSVHEYFSGRISRFPCGSKACVPTSSPVLITEKSYLKMSLLYSCCCC